MVQDSTAALNRTNSAELRYDSIEVDPSMVLGGKPEWRYAKAWHNDGERVVAASFKSTPGQFRRRT
jgi:hypothetical protein